MQGVVDAVARDVEILLDEGVDAVMFCNENDRPYRLEASPGRRRGDGARRGRARAARPPVRGRLPVGRRAAALGVAAATGASFIREVMPGRLRERHGPVASPTPAPLLRERRALGADDVAVLMNVTPEFASPLGTRPPGMRARSAVVSTLADAILVSGPMAGAEPDARGRARGRRRGRRERAGPAQHRSHGGQHRRVRCRFIDGVIVGSDLKRDGGTWNPVDRERVRRFLAAARERLTSPVLLGLDVGTTALKAVLLDPARGLVAAVSRATTPPRRRRRGRRPTPSAWLGERARDRARGVRGGRHRARRRRPRSASPAACRACCCSTPTTSRCARRCSTTTAAPTGDRRAARRARRRARVLQRTGAGVTQQSVGPKLRWLQRHEPRAVVARRGASAAPTTGSAGGSPARRYCERNWALESGLYDLEHAARSPTTCWPRPAGMRRGPVADPRSRRRRRRRQRRGRRGHGLRAGTPVVAGLADHVASAFGAGPRRRTATCSSSSAARSTCSARRDRLLVDDAPLPRRPSAPRACGCRTAAWRPAARRSAGSSASSRAARRWRSSTPRRPRCRPAPTAS